MSRVFVVLLLLCVAPIVGAQSPTPNSDPRLTGFDAEITRLVRRYEAPGLAVAVVAGGRVVYARGFGYRNRERQLPVTTRTLFPIGSMAKAFTSALVGTLEAEHRLSLTDRPAELVPDLVFQTEEMNRRITIADLLAHRSGLGNMDASTVLFPVDARGELASRLRHLPPTGAVGASWEYSNMGYALLGGVIEAACRCTWEAAVRDRLLDPLGMTHAVATLPEMLRTADHATGYGLREGRTVRVPYEDNVANRPGGSGAIGASVRDMATWLSVWLEGGRHQGRQIVPADYVRAATSAHVLTDGSPPAPDAPGRFLFSYGYGWMVSAHDGFYKVSHGGNVSGFSGSAVLFPTAGVGVVALANQTNSVLPGIVTDMAAARMLRIPRRAPDTYPVIVGPVNTLVPTPERTALRTAAPPTVPLERLTGSYTHPGYGTFRVVLSDGVLRAHFPFAPFLLTHAGRDTFRLALTAPVPELMRASDFTLAFVADDRGVVSGVRVNLRAEPVEFRRTEAVQAEPRSER